MPTDNSIPDHRTSINGALTGCSARLLALPLEILIEILKACSWTDVLYMRETCKLLYESSKTRAIWAHLVQEHILSKEVPPHLERPIEMQTSHELERLVLRWKSADIGWKRDDGHPARERSFRCEATEIEFTHLVKGGRWFLVTQKSGEVTYYDLEAETISGVQLIPPQFMPWYLLVSLEIDTDSPVLKFNMAFSTTESEFVEDFHGIQIWGVNAVLDDSGYLVGLSASRLAAFRYPHMLSTIGDLSLRGFDVAFTCRNEQIRKWHIIVLDWNQGDGDPQAYYRLRIIATDRTYSWMRIFLLPQASLLFMGPCIIRLHDYSSVKETTDFVNDTQGSGTLHWEQAFQVDAMHGFVFCHENITSVLVSGFTYLFTFSINSISPEPPLVFDVLTYPRDHFDHAFYFGFSRGIFYDNNQGTSILVAYGPRGEAAHLSPPFLCKKILSEASKKFDKLAVDEDTGRVVLNWKKGNIGCVVDYALLLATT